MNKLPCQIAQVESGALVAALDSVDVDEHHHQHCHDQRRDHTAHKQLGHTACWCIYMTGLVLKYLENDIGGLENMQKINEAKARILYDYLDGQEFFHNPVEHRYRSTMNVTFTSPDPDMDKKFCAEAAEAGFVNLKGHRLVGGMRASIYNAMPTEGVEKLVDFMEKFRKANA